jgi:hypothetical protein
MPRAGALIGIAVLLGLGGYAALPDDEPVYLGDMPSIIEQAEAAPSLPEPDVPPPPALPRTPVDGPDPVVPEEPPAIGPPVAAERIPAPVTDVPLVYRPGAGGDGDAGPSGEFLLELPVIPCVDIVEPGLGTFDCLTGELLLPDPGLPDPELPIDPGLPIDPCAVDVPLPVGCPVPPPD